MQKLGIKLIILFSYSININSIKYIKICKGCTLIRIFIISVAFNRLCLSKSASLQLYQYYKILVTVKVHYHLSNFSTKWISVIQQKSPCYLYFHKLIVEFGCRLINKHHKLFSITSIYLTICIINESPTRKHISIHRYCHLLHKFMHTIQVSPLDLNNPVLH